MRKEHVKWSFTALAIAGTVAGLGVRGTSTAEAAVLQLQAVCQAAELPATTLAERTVPLVSDGCDLRGRTIRAGVLAVDVPLEDGSVTASGALREGVQATNELPHDLTVTVRDGQVTTAINSEEVSTEEVDVEPTGSHQPHPSEKPEEPGPGETEPTDPGPSEPEPTAPTPTPSRSGPSDPAEPNLPTPLPTKTVKPPLPLGDAKAAAVQARAVSAECQQTAYNRAPLYNGYWDWSFNKWTTPSYFGQASAEADIKAAATNIDIGYNDCGLRQSLGTDLRYKGLTRELPNIFATGRCGGKDGKNVVGFGSVNGSYLAWACRWTSWRIGDDFISEADVLIDNGYNTFFYYMPTRCSNRYELQGVMTHEFGHVFGLNHVSENDYPSMTMSPNATPCSYRDKTLGKGDYNGLKKRYGA